MNSFGIVTFLQEYPTNFEFNKDLWPLHITQIDTFTTKKSPKIIINSLQAALKDFPVVSTRVESKQMLGPQKNIPVLKLETTARLKLLHETIVGAMRNLNVEFKRPFILGNNFLPHITINPSLNLQINDETIISSICVIDKNNPNTRQIIATIKLS